MELQVVTHRWPYRWSLCDSCFRLFAMYVSVWVFWRGRFTPRPCLRWWKINLPYCLRGGHVYIDFHFHLATSLCCLPFRSMTMARHSAWKHQRSHLCHAQWHVNDDGSVNIVGRAWQAGDSAGILCWFFGGSFSLTGNWHSTPQRKPTQGPKEEDLPNLLGLRDLGCYWIDQQNIWRGVSSEFFRGFLLFFWGKWSQIHWQCEVNRNYRIDLDVHVQNSFGMGELNRSISIYAFTRNSVWRVFLGDWTLQRSCHWR